jgi:hypothetical protein
MSNERKKIKKDHITIKDPQNSIYNEERPSVTAVITLRKVAALRNVDWHTLGIMKV